MIAGVVAVRTSARNAELLGHLHVVVALGAGNVALILARHRRQFVLGGLDGVYAVAVGADRSVGIAGGQRLAVNALCKLSLLTGVALGAGHGHVGAEDRRSEVTRAANVMRAVAIRADRGFFVPGGYQFAVYRLLIGKSGLAGHARHRLSVALPAHLGDIDLRRTGLGITGGQNLMNIAVAAFAGCCFYIAGGQRLPVNTIVV